MALCRTTSLLHSTRKPVNLADLDPKDNETGDDMYRRMLFKLTSVKNTNIKQTSNPMFHKRANTLFLNLTHQNFGPKPPSSEFVPSPACPMQTANTLHNHRDSGTLEVDGDL